jgi:hypothetical protein
MSTIAINPVHLSDRRMRQEFLTGPFLDLITDRTNRKLEQEYGHRPTPKESPLRFSIGAMFAKELNQLITR